MHSFGRDKVFIETCLYPWIHLIKSCAVVTNGTNQKNEWCMVLKKEDGFKEIECLLNAKFNF